MNGLFVTEKITPKCPYFNPDDCEPVSEIYMVYFIHTNNLFIISFNNLTAVWFGYFLLMLKCVAVYIQGTERYDADGCCKICKKLFNYCPFICSK